MKGFYFVECRDGRGNLKWSEEVPNAIYNEGEYAFLDITLRNGTAPASWYIGLMSTSLLVAPAVNSTLSSLSLYELTNATDPGYSVRQPINRDSTSSGWPTLVINSNAYQATAATATWTASGNWVDTIRWLFLTTVGTVGDTTGKLISLAQLSADRSLLNGDSLSITYSIKL